MFEQPACRFDTEPRQIGAVDVGLDRDLPDHPGVGLLAHDPDHRLPGAQDGPLERPWVPVALEAML
jgi:hypothetical protein